MYAVLGCGRFAYEIICALDYNREDFLLIDEDADNLARLEKEGFKVLNVEAFSPEIIESKAKGWDKVFILGDDSDTNLKLIKIIRKLLPNATIIANVLSNEDKQKTGKIGGIITIRASEIATCAFKSALEASETERTASLIRRILQKT